MGWMDITALAAACIAAGLLLYVMFVSIDENDAKVVVDDGTIRNIELVESKKTYFGKVRKSVNLAKRRRLSKGLFGEDIT